MEIQPRDLLGVCLKGKKRRDSRKRRGGGQREIEQRAEVESREEEGREHELASFGLRRVV